MAYITESKGKWRVQIERLGARKSQSFDTEAAARAWAADFEPKLVERRKMRQALADSTLLSRLPRRVLTAMNGAEYSHHEVALGAIPLPMVSGVYFLVHQGAVVYVGQSVDVLGRISRHRREARDFDAFNYILCPPDKMNALEALYIAAFMPDLNTSFGCGR